MWTNRSSEDHAGEGHTIIIISFLLFPFGTLILTLAISSLFLNSPFIKVTFPFISNSVHRRRSSFDAFAARARARLSPPSVSSSNEGGLRVSAAGFLRLKSQNLRRIDRFLVDEKLRVCGDLERGSNAPDGDDGTDVAHFKEVRFLDGGFTPEKKRVWSGLTSTCVLPEGRLTGNGVDEQEGSLVETRRHADGWFFEKRADSDWARRNRRSDAEGTEGFKGDGESISVWY